MVAALAAAAMLAASLPVAAQTVSATGHQAACEVADEARFRAEIERLTMAALERGLANVSYDAVVADVWRQNGIDLVLDTEVERTVEAIRAESSWGKLLETLASKDAAQQLAAEAAERTYRSDAVKAAIETLAGSVGRELAGRIELATLDAAVPAVACVRAFLGPRYGSTIMLMVADDTGRAFEVDAAAAKAEVGTGDVVLSGKGLMAGAVVLIVRRTLSNMAKRIGQRVVGAVLGRLVSVVAGGVGLVLIAKDIWDFRHGVLPIIEAEMKSEDSKAKVRAELSAAISEQLGTHLGEVASGTADRILTVWREFRAAHAKVVDLAERHDEFKAFVDSVAPAALPKVDRVVALALAGEGEDGVRARIADGTLDEAVKRLPDAALDIAEDTGSLAEGIAWARLAGPAIGKAARYELHRSGKAASFTKSGLERLLALNDESAIRKLAVLNEAERAALGELDPERLAALARSLDTEALRVLARYLQALPTGASGRLLEAIARDPQLMRSFARGYVEHAVLSSRDRAAAVDMIIERGPLFDLPSLERHVRRVAGGDVHPFLLWERHPAGVLAGIAGLLILLLILRRLLLGGRRKTVQPAAG